VDFKKELYKKIANFARNCDASLKLHFIASVIYIRKKEKESKIKIK